MHLLHSRLCGLLKNTLYALARAVRRTQHPVQKVNVRTTTPCCLRRNSLNRVSTLIGADAAGAAASVEVARVRLVVGIIINHVVLS